MDSAFVRQCLLILLIAQHVSGEAVDLKESSKNSGSVLNPRQLKISIDMGSNNLDLNLTRNSNLDNMALVVMGNKGIFSPWNEQRSGDYAVYQDPNSLASILVVPERSNDGGILREYQGMFRYNGDNYGLRRDQSKRKKRSGSDQYVVTKIPLPTMQFGVQRMPSTTMPYSGELMSYAGDEKKNYVVELLVVVDYSIYKTWYDLSKKKTDTDRQNDAINGIRYYYAQIVNGMDLRYATIGEKDFSIRVRLAGYYIAVTARDSVWTEADGIRQVINGEVFSDAYKALDKMETWINNSARNLPTFDQASLFTNNILMAGTYNDGGPRSISGLANIEGICGRGRASVNKEGGEYSSTETGAHELGHNLGAQHDGTSNNCDGSKQYIMSSAPAQLTVETFLNPYKFSSCSIDYFRRFLGTLKMMNANCLLQTSTNVDPSQVDKSSKIPPGQFINIDQQCQHLYGIDSYYCGGNSNDKTMCSQLWCYDPDLKRCVTKTELRAANGTTCGNKKWCVMGKCTDSASAPIASDFCLSGDYRGDVIDCRSVLAKNSGRCYESYINETCCASCQTIRERHSDSCPYGDSDPAYCQKDVIAQYCYDPRIRQQCCTTCKNYEMNIPDCPYGDKANWCATSDNSVCYSALSTCCATCYYRYIGYQDCEYGDRTAWCQTLPKSQCVDSSTAALCCVACDPKKASATVRPKPTTLTPSGGGGSQTPDDPTCQDTADWCSVMPKYYCYTTQKICCRTCKSYYTEKSGCEYGNRFTWCKKIPRNDCTYLENQQDCCEQCPEGSGSGRNTVRLFQFVSITFIFLLLESQFTYFFLQ